MKNENSHKTLRYDYVHWGQIPTKKRVIKTALWFDGHKAVRALLNALTSEQGSYVQKNYMLIAAAIFERISCLIYSGSDGLYHKLPEKTYRIELFEDWAETPEEVLGRIRIDGYTLEKAEHIHKLIWQVADLVCQMMECITEQAFVSEYAYAIAYLIRHDGDLPKPEIGWMFPTNYEDYKYTEGIAKEIDKCFE